MAQKRLEQDLNFIQQAPLEIQMFEGDMNIIQKLDDEPNDVGGLTSAELKAEFDKAGNTIKTYINETLIPAILSEDATEKERIAAEAARKQAETERDAAETLRLSAEQERLSAEEARKTAETARLSAEEARISAETERIAAETVRQDKESGYVIRSETAAKSAESWAVGGTGTRPGEDSNNAEYWAKVAKAIAGGGVTAFNGRGGNVVPQRGDYSAEMVGAIDAGEKAAPHGVATLDENGQVTASQLKTAVPAAVPGEYRETLKTLLEKLGETIPPETDIDGYPAIAGKLSPKLHPDHLLSQATAARYGLGADATVDDVLKTLAPLAPAGTILWYAAPNAPEGYLICDGSAVSRTTYANLFRAISTRFGGGDGKTTFHLPDLRSAFIRGAGHQSGYTAPFGARQEASGIGDPVRGDPYPRYVNVDKTVSMTATASDYFWSLSSDSTGRTSVTRTVIHFRPYNIVLTPIIKY